MPVAEWITFVVAISILTITPGLDTVLVIRNTSRGGWKDGVTSSFGICSGLFVHATLSAVGISFILVQSAWLFQTVKIIGAAYLIYLGICSLRSGWKAGSLGIVSNQISDNQFNMKRSFSEGFLSNVLNPKTAIFYLAFLPQFINPEGSAISQSFILAGIHFILAMTWQSSLAFVIERAKSWLAKPKTNQWLQSLTGCVMVGLGLQLLLSKNVRL
ncbi:threonine transporter RhtB [Photobacterium frigidiphilum]|uniref:Threonine transporter RhtB n=1 Tax=Photobacterium frigidiphilum TaxID=264736 RepID=A0A2T3JJE9_9GAMM|nr:LysE family translocator [Photobacterium frigidiphilum]PSU49134.1 threonine transporter RhtB [Photobacterium frigidiphilum]